MRAKHSAKLRPRSMSKTEFFRQSYIDIYHHGKDLRLYVSDGRRWYINKIPREHANIEAGILKYDGHMFAWYQYDTPSAGWGFWKAKQEMNLKDDTLSNDVCIRRYHHNIWRELAYHINEFMSTNWIFSASYFARQLTNLLPVPLAFAEANRRLWDKEHNVPKLLRSAYEIAKNLDTTEIKVFSSRDTAMLHDFLYNFKRIARGDDSRRWSGHDKYVKDAPQLIQVCHKILMREDAIRMVLEP